MLNWNEIVKRIFSLFPVSSQTELGEMIGVSQDTISRWATGKAKPSWDYIKAISEQTGKSEEWILLGGEPEDTTPPAVADEEGFAERESDIVRAIRSLSSLQGLPLAIARNTFSPEELEILLGVLEDGGRRVMERVPIPSRNGNRETEAI